jgi:hypothetical protein
MHYIPLATGVTLLILMITPSSIRIDGLIVLLALTPMSICVAVATGFGVGNVNTQTLMQFNNPDATVDSLKMVERWALFSGIHFLLLTDKWDREFKYMLSGLVFQHLQLCANPKCPLTKGMEACHSYDIFTRGGGAKLRNLVKAFLNEVYLILMKK